MLIKKHTKIKVIIEKDCNFFEERIEAFIKYRGYVDIKYAIDKECFSAMIIYYGILK